MRSVGYVPHDASATRSQPPVGRDAGRPLVQVPVRPLSASWNTATYVKGRHRPALRGTVCDGPQLGWRGTSTIPDAGTRIPGTCRFSSCAAPCPKGRLRSAFSRVVCSGTGDAIPLRSSFRCPFRPTGSSVQGDAVTGVIFHHGTSGRWIKASFCGVSEQRRRQGQHPSSRSGGVRGHDLRHLSG